MNHPTYTVDLTPPAGAVAAGLAAGLLPARRAGRLDVLTAVATQ